ncbi:hypothetical protein CROQUDRAFT_71345 [Cronartium quercuum f. sp. fusiforme G11]|uniref:DUF7872 domain-containing protein n=1 Tax=Cronartium quercuum f. sp. fusiforme G11 TaxID=708437 RepID=A0A9P6THR9_9BASI|nr:hypothetical protein CROQUDRAFT_71345 [Cronartium quercuum f. sp. fusiforme G11]
MRQLYHDILLLFLITYLVSGQSLDTKCETGPISQKTWTDLKIDSYLSDGKSWNNSTLEEYAKSVRANNFRCGIGQQCMIGQICSPVQAPDWHVLYAVQEWNLRMNLLYKISAFAIDIVKESTSALLSDLTEPDSGPRSLMTSAVFVGLFASLTGLVALAIASVSPASIAVEFFASSALLSTGAVVILPDIAPMISTRPERQEFVSVCVINPSLATIGYVISKWGLEYHRNLNEWVKNLLQAPMNSPGGLMSILEGGKFFLSQPTISVEQLLDGYRDVLLARVVVAVLRGKNAFITRGKDLCTGKGPNGADVGSDQLSWCDKSGVMMRIVTAKGDKASQKIYASEIIAAKYGFSTELLTTSSWNCQQKYGMGKDPYRNKPLPNDIHAECVINLPVCDCTRIDIQKARQEHGLVVACRGVGFLPI